jgi:hypothetical protein
MRRRKREKQKRRTRRERGEGGESGKGEGAVVPYSKVTASAPPWSCAASKKIIIFSQKSSTSKNTYFLSDFEESMKINL